VVLSKRERTITIATIATLALVILYTYAIDPKLEELRTQADKIAKAQADKDNGEIAIKRSTNVSPIWNQRVTGPLKKTASLAESQVLENVVAWGKDAGMTGMSINKPDRIEKENAFSKITFRATARSSVKQLADFMYRIQTAKIPVRITDLTVTSPKEVDDLTVSMGISTIFLNPEVEGKPTGGIAAKAGTP
jgi:hypothetical protein